MKKYTLMLFDENKMGKIRTVKLGIGTIKFVLFLVLGYMVTSGGSFFFLQKLYKERSQMLAFKSENVKLQQEIAGYAKQLNEISEKLALIDELEFKVRNLATYQKQPSATQQTSIGGKEVDTLRDFSALADRKEKDFFDNLNDSLQTLGNELEKREMSLSELSAFLEEQKLIMRSTPSIWPVRGWISSGFGYRISPFSNRKVFHEGLDIATKYGTPMAATAKGIVIFSGRKAGYGWMVTIDHGYGYVTRYGHNSKNFVKVGDKVDKGDIIANVGNSGRSTGPHVHYEVLVNGIPVNPLKFILEDDASL